MVYRDPTYGLPAAEDTDVVKTWPTLSRELVDDLAALFDTDAWLPFTPTVSGCTATTVDCHYRRSKGGLVTIDYHLVVSAVTASITLSLPVAASKLSVLPGVGLGRPSSIYHLGVSLISAGATTINVHSIGANGLRTALSSTVPLTWAPGDFVKVHGTYKCDPIP